MARKSPVLSRLQQRNIPDWWSNAKFGIFIHWTMAAVPGFAPVGTEFANILQSKSKDAYGYTPYVEWYQNSMLFPSSPVSKFHAANYGDVPYHNFRADFEAGIEAWNPSEWVQQFVDAGAEYVVLVSKHHDGYCLWPSEVENPHRPGWNSRRDVVGELAKAVREAGLKFGIYYSGGLDWTFYQRPMGQMSDVLASIPRGDYPAYAEAQVRELIDRYQPSVLWNDIAWPDRADKLYDLFAYYYSQVPDGVVNDRWQAWSPLMSAVKSRPVAALIDAGIRRSMKRNGGLVPPPPPHFDVRTPEYVVFPSVKETPWECVRGMDDSFGHNEASLPEHFISHDDLLWLVTDIAAKGGNLLLNVGPRGVDGSIPELQAERLRWLAEWLPRHEAALKNTRPWLDRSVIIPATSNVRYNVKDHTVYAIVRNPARELILEEVATSPSTTVTTIDGTALRWRVEENGLAVTLLEAPDSNTPVVVVLTGVSYHSLH